MFLRLLFFLFSLLQLGGFAQQRIQDFNVFQSDNYVGVRFNISPGPACNGYDVMHSTDSINYISVYNYAGICGDRPEPDPQSYTHTSPALNQMNFYRIQLNFPYEQSEVRRLYVNQAGRARMSVYPNPIVQNTEILNLRFYNAESTNLVGFLYDRFGTVMRELELTTNGDLAPLPVGNLRDGLYVIFLTDGLSAYSSKFIVIR